MYVQSIPERLDPVDVWSLIERERLNFLLIVGDAFGFWELTQSPDEGTKLDTIVAHHPDLFRQLRETGERCRITLLPGNHDYDLACVPGYADALARHGIPDIRLLYDSDVRFLSQFAR